MVRLVSEQLWEKKFGQIAWNRAAFITAFFGFEFEISNYYSKFLGFGALF